MATHATLWTVAAIEARRRTGDSLVTVGDWSCGFTTGDGIGDSVHSAKLGLTRHERGGYKVIERDARDGEVFATSDDAECYALNAGRLQWYRDTDTYKASQARRAAGRWC